MTAGGPVSERAVLLLPMGRDVEVATRLLTDAGMRSISVPDIAYLGEALEGGAGLVIAAEECFHSTDLTGLAAWFAAQPPWSDLPVLVLTLRGGGPERNPALARLPALLGNVAFVERPFHPATLANAARSALRGRRRQYEARARLEELARAETALRTTNDALERRVEERTRELAEAQARLVHAQRMEALGQLAGGIAHDFNNVLQAVAGGAGLILRRPGDVEGVRRIARMVAEAAERGAAVTRRLLAFSRRGELRAEPVDAAALLADLREVLTHTLGTGVGVRVEAPVHLPALLADKGQLETVLVNLSTNARDAMAGQGVLTLAATVEFLATGLGLNHSAPLAPGTYLRLTVADTGAGMTPEVLRRATEPFFTTKAQGKGTGLGLAMARGFAEQSGGGLTIESEAGRGTAVHLWLPVAEAEVSTAPAETMISLAPAAARILLVDDEEVVRTIVAESLREAGYAVTAAAGGREALALLDSGSEADLLISDLSMPDMDGLTVVREVQRRRPGLPAILLTGFATNVAEIALGGAMSGTFSLLRKPVDTQQLAERAAMLLARQDVVRPASEID